MPLFWWFIHAFQLPDLHISIHAPGRIVKKNKGESAENKIFIFSFTGSGQIIPIREKFRFFDAFFDKEKKETHP